MNRKFVPVIGIDISKRKFDACLIKREGEGELYSKFENNQNGFKDFLVWIKKNKVKTFHVCLEPTGKFSTALAEFILDTGNIVSIVNAYRIKGFAISELKRSKSDKIDAGIIARFCIAHRPEPWFPLTPELQEIQELGRYADALKCMMTQEKNRLSSGKLSEFLRIALEQHIDSLQRTISQLEIEMKRISKSDSKLKKCYQLLVSIVGVGDVAALTFLGEIGTGERFIHTRQVESYCGMVPRIRQSGSSINGKSRLSKVGNSRMRKALYMPALSAIQANPALREFAARLDQAGKPPKVVICAAMRKLLRIMFAVVRSDRPYERNYVPIKRGTSVVLEEAS